MELAGVDDGQEFSFRGYTDDLLLSLSEEKESVEEMLIYLDELAIAFQGQVEELMRKRKEQEKRVQRRRTNSKTPERLGLSLALPVRPNMPRWTVMKEKRQTLFPIPQEGREDNKSTPQLGVVTDNLHRQSHWGCNQRLQHPK